MEVILTSSKELVWSILLLRHLAAAILFLSLLTCRRSSSSGLMPMVLVGLLPPILRLVCCPICCDCCWLSMIVELELLLLLLFPSWLWWICGVEFELFIWLLWCPGFWVWAGVGCDGSTKGGTKPASRLWDALSLVNSRKVCSILRNVVGVNVGVVLVGTPLWSPSSETSCNKKKDGK